MDVTSEGEPKKAVDLAPFAAAIVSAMSETSAPSPVTNSASLTPSASAPAKRQTVVPPSRPVGAAVDRSTIPSVLGTPGLDPRTTSEPRPRDDPSSDEPPCFTEETLPFGWRSVPPTVLSNGSTAIRVNDESWKWFAHSWVYQGPCAN